MYFYYLQRFFGCVRQAGGSNDHPATPTFLQIYKILSSYSILAPPKYGNCSIEKEIKLPLITLNDIKSLYQKSNKETGLSIDIIKSKLNNAIRNDDWDIHDVFESEHDYAKPEAFDCIIYYITGRVCQQLLKCTKCSTCKQALITNSENCNSKAKLSDMLVECFVHPHIGFYNFIKKFESLFIKHCDDINVADAILSDVINCNMLTFPCEIHKLDVVSYIVHYYVQMRLSRLCTDLNNNIKNNQHIKKISKHYTT